jgi:hypothetical protein
MKTFVEAWNVVFNKNKHYDPKKRWGKLPFIVKVVIDKSTKSHKFRDDIGEFIELRIIQPHLSRGDEDNFPVKTYSGQKLFIYIDNVIKKGKYFTINGEDVFVLKEGLNFHVGEFGVKAYIKHQFVEKDISLKRCLVSNEMIGFVWEHSINPYACLTYQYISNMDEYEDYDRTDEDCFAYHDSEEYDNAFMLNTLMNLMSDED